MSEINQGDRITVTFEATFVGSYTTTKLGHCVLVRDEEGREIAIPREHMVKREEPVSWLVTMRGRDGYVIATHEAETLPEVRQAFINHPDAINAKVYKDGRKYGTLVLSGLTDAALLREDR